MSTPPAGRAALRLAGVFVVLLGAVLAVGWLLVHPLASSIGAADNDVARWFAARRTTELTDVAEVGTFLGLTPVGEVSLAVIGVVVALVVRSWRPLVFVAVTYAGIGVVYFAATHLDERDRPPVKILDTGLVPNHSFPSGHVGTATAIVLCLALLLSAYGIVRGRWLWVLALVPLLVLLSRLYQGAHHLTDVLTALATAVVWGLACARQLLPRDRAKTGG
jgi:membrane-associated phospholipid phosphatase